MIVPAHPVHVIGHVLDINILTRLRGFQDKLLYLVLFPLYPSLFWELRDKRNFKKLHFLLENLGAMLDWYIEHRLLGSSDKKPRRWLRWKRRLQKMSSYFTYESEVIYFVYHSQSYHETGSRTHQYIIKKIAVVVHVSGQSRIWSFLVLKIIAYVHSYRVCALSRNKDKIKNHATDKVKKLWYCRQ